MKQIITIFIQLVLFLPLFAATASKPAAQLLQIKVGPVKHNRGMVRLLLFDNARGWPHSLQRARRRINLPARGGMVTFTVRSLKPGRWAVSVYHDEDNDGKLDKNLFGAPSEGYGVSQDAVRKFGAPRFNKALFKVTAKRQTIRIPLHY